MPELEVPTAEEIFDKPYPPAPPIPQAWDAEHSIAAALADRECARLIANYLFDPPITEEEIDKYAREFKIPRCQAELEIRRTRDER